MDEEREEPKVTLSPGLVLAGIGFFVLLFVLLAGRAWLIYRDFREGPRLLPTIGVPTVEELPIIASTTLNLVMGLDFSYASDSPLGMDLFDLTSNPMEQGSGLVPRATYLKAFATFPRDIDLEAELDTRIFPQIASLIPPVTDVGSASSYLTEFQIGHLTDMSRLVAALARYQAATGRVRQGIRSLLCLLLIADQAENVFARQVYLMQKMVAIIIRSQAVGGLLELAPAARLSRDELGRLIGLLQLFERRSPPLSKVISSITAATRNQVRDIYSRLKTVPGGYSGPIPRRYLAIIGDPQILEPYLEKVHGPLIEALQASFPLALRRLKEQERVMEELKMRPTTFGSQWLQYAWKPEYYFLDKAFYTSYMHYSGILIQEGAAWEGLRGAQIAFALHSFIAREGAAPPNLDALASWTGVTFPPDWFSGKPHGYELASGPRLFSFGEDMAPGTPDDLLFVPVWDDPSFSPLATPSAPIVEEPLFPGS